MTVYDWKAGINTIPSACQNKSPGKSLRTPRYYLNLHGTVDRHFFEALNQKYDGLVD